MNVATSNLEPASHPTAAPLQAQGNGDDVTPKSFADAMQSAQPTASRAGSASAPRAAKADGDAAHDAVDVLEHVPPTPQVQLAAAGEVASPGNSTAAPTSVRAKADPSVAPAITGPAGSEPVDAPSSVKAVQPMFPTCDLPAGNAPAQEAAADADIPRSASIPNGEASIGSKVLKASAAGDANSAKPSIARKGKVDNAIAALLPHVDRGRSLLASTDMIPPASPRPVNTPEQDTAALTALQPAVAAPTPADSLPSKALQTVQANGRNVPIEVPAVDPAIMTADLRGAIPAAAMPAAASAAAASLVLPAADDRSETRFEGNVFAEAAALSPVSSTAGAMFAPSLVLQAPPVVDHRSYTAASAPGAISVSSTAEGPAVQSAPVRRLDIAVNDPVLGNLDVRAEMRGGNLHASVTGTQEGAAAAMPALHQFLQQHEVNVHTLTYATATAGVAAAGPASSSGSMSRDTAGSFAADPGTAGQQRRQDGAQTEPQGYGAGYDGPVSAATYRSSLPVASLARSAGSTLPNGSTLSIHI